MHPFIKDLKAKLKKKKLKGLAVDVDDTLARTGDFWIKGLMEKFGNPEGLSVEEVQQKYRYSYYAPYWSGKEVRAWEKQVRHDDRLHRDFPLIKNANHIVNQIHQIIQVVVYLTARSKSVMPGTRVWLKKYGFPQAEVAYRTPGVKLPESLSWKAKVLEYLYPQVIGMVDDHPQLAKDLSKKYPGTLYLYNYHDQAPRGDINIIPCKNWNEVLEKVRRLA